MGANCFPPRATINSECGGTDREDRKSKAVMNSKYDKGNECFKYGGQGHFAVVCPTWDQKFTLVCGNTAPKAESNNNAPPSEDDDSDEKVLEEVLKGSQLPVCVI
jgi:hypothetical protein